MERNFFNKVKFAIVERDSIFNVASGKLTALWSPTVTFYNEMFEICFASTTLKFNHDKFTILNYQSHIRGKYASDQEIEDDEKHQREEDSYNSETDTEDEEILSVKDK